MNIEWQTQISCDQCDYIDLNDCVLSNHLGITGREPFLKGVIRRGRDVIKMLLVLVDKLSACQQEFHCAWQAFRFLVIDYDTVDGKISKNCSFRSGWLLFSNSCTLTTYDSHRGGWTIGRKPYIECKLIYLFLCTCLFLYNNSEKKHFRLIGTSGMKIHGFWMLMTGDPPKCLQQS